MPLAQFTFQQGLWEAGRNRHDAGQGKEPEMCSPHCAHSREEKRVSVVTTGDTANEEIRNQAYLHGHHRDPTHVLFPLETSGRGCLLQNPTQKCPGEEAPYPNGGT